MKFGFRTPSLKKSIAARTSLKRKIMPRMPKGSGFLRNPEKALYNKIYNKTTVSLTKALTTKPKKNNRKNEFSTYQYRNKRIKNPCTVCLGTQTVDMNKTYKNILVTVATLTIMAFLVSNAIGIIMLIVFALCAYFLNPKGGFYCNDCKKYFEI